jgi:hypothetical protein
MAIETYFLVLVNDNGTVNTTFDIPEKIEAVRQATNFDVYQTCKQIATEVDNQLLAEKVATYVAATLMPQEPLTSDKVKEALKERGIVPDKE